MVLKAKRNNLVINLWVGSGCNEDLSRSGKGTPVKTKDGGSTHQRAINCLWWYYEGRKWRINPRMRSV